MAAIILIILSVLPMFAFIFFCLNCLLNIVNFLFNKMMLSVFRDNQLINPQQIFDLTKALFLFFNCGDFTCPL